MGEWAAFQKIAADFADYTGNAEAWSPWEAAYWLSAIGWSSPVIL